MIQAVELVCDEREGQQPVRGVEAVKGRARPCCPASRESARRAPMAPAALPCSVTNADRQWPGSACKT
jgi:hypothetical protein